MKDGKKEQGKERKERERKKVRRNRKKKEGREERRKRKWKEGKKGKKERNCQQVVKLMTKERSGDYEEDMERVKERREAFQRERRCE
uniref:Uncharacterized protein n=1 Tax=Octopus bimaculoides TaxID=37653 RepID=A0A0L8H0E5_OCTBM